MATAGRNSQFNANIRTLLDYMMRKKLYEEQSNLSMKEIEAQGLRQQEYISASKTAEQETAAYKADLEAKAQKQKFEDAAALNGAAEYFDAMANRAESNKDYLTAKENRAKASALRREASTGLVNIYNTGGLSPEQGDAALQAGLGSEMGAGLSNFNVSKREQENRIAAKALADQRDKTENRKVTVDERAQDLKDKEFERNPTGKASSKATLDQGDVARAKALYEKAMASDKPLDPQISDYVGGGLDILAEIAQKRPLTKEEKDFRLIYLSLLSPPDLSKMAPLQKKAYLENKGNRLADLPVLELPEDIDVATPVPTDDKNKPTPTPAPAASAKSPREEANIYKSIFMKKLQAAGMEMSEEEINAYLESTLEKSGIRPRGTFVGIFGTKK